MKRFCSQCLEIKEVFLDTDRTGLLICHDCFGKRYRKYYNRTNTNVENPTIYDLKKKWERK